MRILPILVILGVVVAHPVTARAAEPAPLAAAVCANCHGTEGRNEGAIPAIAGKPAFLIAGKLRDFKADKVANATVMPRLTKGLTEAEIDTVAQYFANLR
ncbi:c-type cytochrome [Paramagnetospirillum caucaseum]|nr:c-type cytochrome [Paramagnetospirillum caucaseum]